MASWLHVSVSFLVFFLLGLWRVDRKVDEKLGKESVNKCYFKMVAVFVSENVLASTMLILKARTARAHQENRLLSISKLLKAEPSILTMNRRQ